MYAFFNNISEVGLESTVGGPSTWAKNPRMQITKEDIDGILKFVNKTDTNKLEVSIMKERDTLRKTFILTRGVYDAPAKEVEPSTPPAILPFASTLPRNRLGLAEWLFDPKHPLTARVFVNRMWQEFFAKVLSDRRTILVCRDNCLLTRHCSTGWRLIFGNMAGISNVW